MEEAESSNLSWCTNFNGSVYRRGSGTGCNPVVFDSGGSTPSAPTILTALRRIEVCTSVFETEGEGALPSVATNFKCKNNKMPSVVEQRIGFWSYRKTSNQCW